MKEVRRMMNSRKVRLAIFLGVLFAGGLVRCAEPNEAKTELRFEIGSEKTQEWVNRHQHRVARRLGYRKPTRGRIKPTFVAVFHIPFFSQALRDRHGEILEVLNTPAGKSLSEKQRQFLTAPNAGVWWEESDVEHRRVVILYAVSKDDAKKMVQAYLEAARSTANAKVERNEIALGRFEEEIAKAKKELSETEAELETVIIEYEMVKKKTHSLSSDADAARESKETILEMSRVLDSLTIEITGIEAKLSAIERIKSQRKVSSTEGLAKLEEIKSEQTVELAGALARNKAALNIREREEKFYGLYKQRGNLERQVVRLKDSLRNSEKYRQRVEHKLANPEPEMIPPKLYQNKVTIHPIKTE
jgi:archaellum component FlaC